MHESILPLLDSIDVKSDYRPGLSPLQVLEIIHSYQGIIVRSKMDLDANFFEKAVSLKFIARAGAGMDKIDIAQAHRRGVTLINAPEGNANALAEHALGMLLGIMNNIASGDSEVKHKIWNREGNRGYELSGKCVGIIGYGFMGKAFAQKLALLGCKVIAYDKYLSNFSDNYVTEVSWEQLLKESEIVSLHIPYNSSNKYFINSDFFQQLAKPIWFVNTARGEVLQTSSLIDYLRKGKVRGAALDVLENEKLNTWSLQHIEEFELLKQFPQVLLTPHVGGWTHESYKKINEVLVQKIAIFKLTLET